MVSSGFMWFWMVLDGLCSCLCSGLYNSCGVEVLFIDIPVSKQPPGRNLPRFRSQGALFRPQA